MDTDRSQGIELREGHRWFLDGKPAPGTHEILSHSAYMDAFQDEAAMKDGQRTHFAIDKGRAGKLDWPHFKEHWPHLVGRVESGMKAADYLKVTGTEVKVGHRRLWYCTAVDATGTFAECETVINWKHGLEARWHCLQTAAEHMAYFDDDYFDLEKKTARCCVYLADDGSFTPDQIVPFRNPQDFTDWEHAVGVYESKLRLGYARPLPKVVQRKKKEEPIILPPSQIFEATTAEAPAPQGLFG